MRMYTNERIQKSIQKLKKYTAPGGTLKRYSLMGEDQPNKGASAEDYI